MQRYLFPDLDAAERRIHQLREDIGYLVLGEVVDRNHTETLGRIEFSALALSPWLEQPTPPLFEEAGSLDLESLEAGPSLPDLARAAGRWIRESAGMNMGGRKECKFKVSVWRPKGEQQLMGARFTCEDTEFDEKPVEEAPKVANTPFPATLPLPTPLPDTSPDSRHWRTLGDGYTHLIALLQQSFSHLAGLQNTTISNQNVQMLRLQKVLEELVGEMLKLRIGMAESHGQVVQESRETRVREELGKQFLSELGTFGRVFAASKLGMTPEMAELVEVIGACPELMEAIKNPKVRTMLRDEKTRKELAMMLQLAANPPSEADQAA